MASEDIEFSCAPVTCPPFTDVHLTITAVCDCHGNYDTPLGHSGCPIHGEQIRAHYEEAARRV